MPSNSTKTLRQAAVELLREIGPTHYLTLIERILSRGLAASSVEDASRVVERRDLRIPVESDQ